MKKVSPKLPQPELHVVMFLHFTTLTMPPQQQSSLSSVTAPDVPDNRLADIQTDRIHPDISYQKPWRLGKAMFERNCYVRSTKGCLRVGCR